MFEKLTPYLLVSQLEHPKLPLGLHSNVYPIQLDSCRGECVRACVRACVRGAHVRCVHSGCGGHGGVEVEVSIFIHLKHDASYFIMVTD